MRGIKTRGTMSAEMDALTVVNQLRDLAADPLNRRAIVEDQGCLPGLILFLDHPNPQVVYSALLVSSVHLFPLFYVFTSKTLHSIDCYCCIKDILSTSIPKIKYLNMKYL